MESNRGIFDKLGTTIHGKDYELLQLIFLYSEANKIVLVEVKDKIVAELKETERSFFRRLKKLEKEDIIKRTHRGVYKLNEKWVKAFDATEINEWYEKRQKAINQQPTNERIPKFD